MGHLKLAGIVGLGWLFVTVLGCSSSPGESCAKDGDCRSGQQCVSSGGLFFGDRVCVALSATPGALDASADADTGGAVDAVSDTDGGADVGVDASDTLDDSHIGADADGSADADDTADTDRTADTDVTGDADGGPALETCDGRDNDGDGQIDEDFSDLDESCTVGAGQCRADGVIVCTEDGTATECGAVRGTSQMEICDDKDNDCDGDIDEGLTETRYADADGDGFGDPNQPVEVCPNSNDNGYVTDNTDCDDGNPWTYPGAQEICDGEDNDCDNIQNDANDDGGSATAKWCGSHYVDPDPSDPIGCDIDGPDGQVCCEEFFDATDDCEKETICDNGLDSDLDGKTDCADPDCDGLSCGDGKLCQSGSCQTI